MKRTILAGVFVLAFLIAPNANAQTQAELQTLINSLLQQVTALQAQLDAVSNSSGSANSNSGPGSTSFSRNLTIGMSGSDVSALQRALTARGFYNDDITGYFGPVTRGAVQRFQASRGIQPTGFFGSQTRAAISDSDSAIIEESQDSTNTGTTGTDRNNAPSLTLTVNGESVTVRSWDSDTEEVTLSAGEPLTYSWRYVENEWWNGTCSFTSPFNSGVSDSGSSTLNPSHPYYPKAGERKLFSITCGWPGSVNPLPLTAFIYVESEEGEGGQEETNEEPVENEPVPTVTLAANPSIIKAGESSLLKWSSANAEICDRGSIPAVRVARGQSASAGTSGSISVSPTVSTTYSIHCSNSSGEYKGGTATVTVVELTIEETPTVSLTASPSSIVRGSSTRLTWSATNATSCTTPDSRSSGGTSGYLTLYPTNTTTYQVACYNGSKSTTKNVTVSVIELTAEEPEEEQEPSSSDEAIDLKVGNSDGPIYQSDSGISYATTLSWSATGLPDNCKLSSDKNGLIRSYAGRSGSISSYWISGSEKFTLACDDGVKDTVEVIYTNDGANAASLSQMANILNSLKGILDSISGN